jgi:hypothetical protein
MAVDANQSDDESLDERFRTRWDVAGASPDIDAFLAAHKQATPQERLEVIRVDQHCRADAGCLRTPESYLASHPDIASDKDRKLSVVYEDYRLRKEYGEPPDPEDYCARFPDIRDALRRQFDVASWMAAVGDLEGAAGDETVDAVQSGAAMSAEADAPDALLSLSDFELGPAFPESGMGVVHRAWQRSMRRRVALKFLKGDTSPESVRRFLAEAHTVARLRHPGIVPIYGRGRASDGRHFLVMELIDGPSLAERMKVAAIRPATAAGYIADVADAIQHAHERGVIHRDLKPGNILLDRSGRALVTDFGLAKQLQASSPELSHPDQVIGTLEYMAPEQVDRSWGAIGPATDIYGLGATLYAMLSGRPPFLSEQKIELLLKVRSNAPPPAVRSLRPDVPAGLEAICLKCLEKDPAERYGSASELARELRDWSSAPQTKQPAAATGIGCDRPVIAASTSVPPSGRRRHLWLVPIPALLLLAVAASFALGPLLAPEAIPIESVDVVRGTSQKAGVRLTGGPVSTAEGIAIDCKLSRPGYPCLFWIHSQGSVVNLYPADSGRAAAPVGRFRWPAGAAYTKFDGPPGPEVGILFARNRPWSAKEIARLTSQLQPRQSLGKVAERTFLIDELPIEHSMGGTSDEPMLEAQVVSYLQDVRRMIEPEVGTIRTITLSLVEKR